jgi:AbrB family looped-hinge helix DNA binding protein
METSIVTRKGQVTIPARLRRRLRLEEGSVVGFSEKDGELVLRPVESTVEAAFGLVQAKRTASLEDIEVAIRAKGRA